MKLRQWLFSSLIGASFAGWLCLAEFALVSSDYDYFFTKHTLTGPLVRYMLAGACLTLIAYPLRALISTRSIRHTSPHMATGLFTAFTFTWFVIIFHFQATTLFGVALATTAYLVTLKLFSNKQNFIFSSFFSPTTHAPSVIILSLIGAYCAIDFPAESKAASPNVLLIAIDNASAEHFGCYEYHRATSPNIDKLSDEGATYDLFSGPVTDEISNYAASLNQDFSTCLVSLRHSDFNSDDFDTNINLAIPELPHRLAINAFAKRRLRGDRYQLEGAATFINTTRHNGQAFFMIYNMQACTNPNDIPDIAKGHFSASTSDAEKQLISNYDECIWYQDRLVAELLSRLDEKDLREDTIIIICGNQTPTSFEHDNRVPLIIRYPKLIDAGSRLKDSKNSIQLVSEIMRLIDLANTAAT
jgi:hypothetical protein